MYNWPVMKLCEAQLRDINPEDVLANGLYRRCNTYRGGGGYDRFPAIYLNRFGFAPNLNDQFVVQLKGCPLSCPYCYVTKAGVVYGDCVQVPTPELVEAYKYSRCGVFHLMGGAPALHIQNWPELIENLEGAPFHSDLLLVENRYPRELIRKLASLPNCLYAVSIKGWGDEEFRRNTDTVLNSLWFVENLKTIVEEGLPFYFTSTGLSQESIDLFKNYIIETFGEPDLLRDMFNIQVVHYKALD